MRTVATFESAEFNLAEHRDYFINEGCFGDDVARWLIEGLRAEGAIPDAEPGQEDFGWFVNYSLEGKPFCAVIGNVGGEFWFVAVERVTGLVGSLLGQRRRQVPAAGVECVHRILSSSATISNLRWHHWEIFRRGGTQAFESGAELPSAP